MFKDKIKKLREAHNLTQEELAKKITVSRTAVSKWETSELISDTDIGDKRRLAGRSGRNPSSGRLQFFLFFHWHSDGSFSKKQKSCAIPQMKP